MSAITLDLGYGNGKIGLKLPKKNLKGILEPKPHPAVPSITQAVKQALSAPAHSAPLKQLLLERRPKSLLVLLSDHTRLIPHNDLILTVLCEELSEAGVDCRQVRALIATGTHRPPTCEEREAMYGPRVFDEFNLYAHKCDQGCISLSKLSSGREVEVNQMLLTSDFTLATGKITPHYLAGFSGGRKAVMPGCASRESIARNHSLVTRRSNAPGKLEGNLIHQEMEETAALARIDFLLNAVPTPDEKIAGIVAGHWQQAWQQGVELCRRVWTAQFDGPADCVIASAGGHPLDINLYQIQRVLNNLEPAVKPGGTIVLVGHCTEGLGQEEFAHFLEYHTLKEILDSPPEALTSEAHRAYATALVMEKCEVVLVSSIEQPKAEALKFKYMPDMASAVEHLKARHGQDFSCYVVPKGNSLLLE
jgi:nickel-dependent lactate racemase